MIVKVWNIEALTGYKPMTTFWEDFTIADRFGVEAVKDTFKRAFESWKDNYKYLTELVMVLNWKGWEFYNAEREKMADVYFECYEEASIYAEENLQGDELMYYYKATD